MALVACRRVISSSPSLSPSPCLLRRPPPPVVLVPFLPHMCRSCPPRVSCVRHASVFSCGFLSLFSPFLRRAGRGVLCLLASFVVALVPSSRFSRPAVPVLACPRGSSSPVPISCGRRPAPVVALCSCLVAVLISFASPRSSTSVGGAGVGSLLLAHRFALVLACGPVVRACVRCRLDSVGGVGLAAWRVGVGGVLCSVCVVIVCIYKLGACSCMIVVVERESV